MTLLKRIALKKIHIFMMLQPASSMGASFHMRMFGTIAGGFREYDDGRLYSDGIENVWGDPPERT